jgi:hypothetical protein
MAAILTDMRWYLTVVLIALVFEAVSQEGLWKQEGGKENKTAGARNDSKERHKQHKQTLGLLGKQGACGDCGGGIVGVGGSSMSLDGEHQEEKVRGWAFCNSVAFVSTWLLRDKYVLLSVNRPGLILTLNSLQLEENHSYWSLLYFSLKKTLLIPHPHICAGWLGLTLTVGSAKTSLQPFKEESLCCNL